MENYSTLDTNAEAVQMVLKLSDRDPSIMIGLIETVLDSSPAIIRRMEDGIRNNDGEKVCLEAHSLKSSSSLVGANNLSDLCKNLELIGKGGQGDKTVQIFENILSEYEAVKKDLENWKQDLEKGQF